MVGELAILTRNFEVLDATKRKTVLDYVLLLAGGGAGEDDLDDGEDWEEDYDELDEEEDMAFCVRMYDAAKAEGANDGDWISQEELRAKYGI